MFLGSLDSFLNHVSLVWYGIPLNVTGYLHDVAIDVCESDPLTPVLPYRTSIKHDDKAEKFLEFVKKRRPPGAWSRSALSKKRRTGT